MLKREKKSNMSSIISKIVADSNYKIEQFSQTEIDSVESLITTKTDKKGKEVYYVKCQIRDKDIKLTDEELVRQLYINKLIDEYNYPKEKMELEYSVSFGREKKRADIVIFDKRETTTPYIIVELKKPKLKDGKEQLKSYCNATGAPIGVWTNGGQISFYHRKDPNFFEDLPNIPTFDEKLSDILSERWTIYDLILKDKLITEKKSLKDLILEMEDEVLANAGVDVFEEVFKLIFTKLYDEMESGRNETRHLEFRNYGDTETELKDKIQKLFDKAKNKWDGVFSEEAKILLSPSHLSVCVSSLQDVKLFNSNLDVVDDAFEYLMSKSSKGEKGQYFTPRYVIDMCVKMLNPKPDETMIDTASGSCGFPVHTIFYVWKQILKEKGIEQSHLFTSQEKPAECTDYVNSNVFAIDFDEKAVRVARTLNLIAGDGQTNVLHLNTLDYERWENTTKTEDWTDTYNEGWKKLKKIRTTKNSDYSFEFDILMANPPFAGDIKESRIIAKYELGKNSKGKYQSKVGRDILFIERNLNFLKPGGRMAIVLPQGRFNNSSDKYIRDFITEHCRILAVVGLHVNVFKPHTGTKTSVLFVQKWDDKLCPKKEDYSIFFATMGEPSKDKSGDKIFVKDKDGLPILDTHGHLIVKHDLFNHDEMTEDGIAEAFIEFAKKENLSFF
jgi:DNA methylase-type I restriction-modification system